MSCGARVTASPRFQRIGCFGRTRRPHSTDDTYQPAGHRYDRLQRIVGLEPFQRQFRKCHLYHLLCQYGNPNAVNTYTVIAVDDAGNESPPATITVNNF